MSNHSDRLSAAHMYQLRPANDNHLAPVPTTVRWFVWLSAECAAWPRRWRSRAELAQFGERDLRDIGVTSADAERECGKPLWRG